ncbi:WxL domain-containing protein [Weissella halotolerans]|nr:WxL domain-containing protein [Weissella halotolerans]
MRNVKLLSAAVLATTALGTALPVVANAADVANYNTTAGVTFTPNTDKVDPVSPDPDENGKPGTIDPNNPVVPVDPDDPNDKNPVDPDKGTQGPLSIDYVSDFNFGKQKISSKDMTYFAKAQKFVDDTKPHVLYAQVTDNRGTGQGWQLNVKQDAEFKTADGTNTLTGAQIAIKGMNTATQDGSAAGQVLAGAADTQLKVGANVLAMNAPVDAGQGTWVDRFGADTDLKNEADTNEDGGARDVDQAVTLSVPGKSNKIADQKYSTSLTWTLSDTPANPVA